MFKADGESKLYDKGLSDFDGDPCGNYVTGGTQIVAGSVAIALAKGPSDEIFMIAFGGKESSDEAYFQYLDESGGFYACPGPGVCSVTITSYGDEGGVIEGEFSGTVEEEIPLGLMTSKQAPSIDITEGKFRIKRLDDDSFNLFAPI
jgi:hypothetical protein